MPELIHGNQDGPNRSNRTYTICRIEVSNDLLVDETDKGLHPGYHVAISPKGKRYVKSVPTHGASTNVVTSIDKTPYSKRAWHCAAQRHRRGATAEGDYQSLPRGTNDHPQMLELIHKDQVGDRFTICRLGVPRRQLVHEITNGLHPGYHVAMVHGRPIPRSNPGGDSLGGPWRCGFLRR